MFDRNQKATALSFAHKLAARDDKAALELCSEEINLGLYEKSLREEFETIVPLDLAKVDSIEFEGNGAFPFVYITLAGNVYSEAIIVHAFCAENGQTKIASFELGRP